MICFSFESTSSKVQLSLSAFWDISRAEVATPPALAALPGAEDHAVLLEILRRFQGGGHIRTLADHGNAVGDQGFRVFKLQLVLGRARKRQIALDGPDALSLVILGIRTIVLVLGEACALHFLDLLESRDIDAVRIIDPAGGIGAGHDLRAELLRLLDRVRSHVAGAGNRDGLACELNAAELKDLLCEIEHAVAGRLCSGKRSAVGQALAGEDALILAGDPLVLAVHEADLTASDADIARRDVFIGSDILIELGHKALAKTHNFRVGFALGVEVRAALAAADGKAGKRVLEDLLEAEELQNADIDRRMKTESALVRSDGAVELDAEGTVHMHVSGVVGPGNTEGDYTLRLDKALQKSGLAVDLFIRVHDRADGLQDFACGLDEFRFIRVLLADDFHYLINI